MPTKINLTVEEVVSTLEHSSLPTIIVEGCDDIVIYRELEKKLEGISVLPVGGRNNILQIFEIQKTNLKLKDKVLIFIADKDIWCYTGVPQKYIDSKIIFTNGYSIENDVFSDYRCIDIIKKEANKRYEDSIKRFIKWYALALQAVLQNVNEEGEYIDQVELIDNSRKLSKHPSDVLNNWKKLIILQENESYPEDLRKNLENNYSSLIRGKSLLDIFSQHFKHHNKKAMFESIAVRPGDKINLIFEEVEKQCIN